MTCDWIPGDAVPACDWDKNCPVHGLGTSAKSPERTHFGPDSFAGVTHKGSRKDCSYPDCAWPREGDWATVPVGEQERTGEVVDLGSFTIRVRTPNGAEYESDGRTAREPDWGTYCPHGLKVTAPVPAEHTCHLPKPPPCMTVDPFREYPERMGCPACYPAERKVQPWPCQENGCMEADFDRATEQEIEEYYESLADHARADW